MPLCFPRPRWLRQLLRTLNLLPPIRRSIRRTRLWLEQCEDRTLPAVITWTNAAAGSWATASNWDLNRVPQAGDDVVLPDLGAAGPSLTVTLSAGAVTINSLSSAEHFTLSGGSLTVGAAGGTTANLFVAGTFTFQAATLANAVIANGTTVTRPFATTAATLDGVTLNGSLNVISGNGTTTTTVRNDLTLNGTVTLNGNSYLTFAGAAGTTQQILSPGGTGLIQLAAQVGGVPGLLQSVDAPAGATRTVAIGAGVTVRAAGPGGSGQVGDTGADQIWVNKGTITAATSAPLSLRGHFYNQGLLTAEAGGTLNVIGDNPVAAQSTWTNFGPTGTTGAMQVNGGTLNLGGRFKTADVGAYSRTGGVIALVGTLDNIGATFALDNTTGSWQVANGATIRGGTVQTTGTAQVVQQFATFPTLDGITLNGTYTTSPGNGTSGLTIRNDLTLNGTLILVGTVTATFAGAAGTTQTIASPFGTGVVRLDGDLNRTASLSQATDSGTGSAVRTVVINPGVTVRTNGPANSSGQIGSAGQIWVNQGTVTALASGIPLTVRGRFYNEGTLTAEAGAVFNLTGDSLVAGQPSWTNFGPTAIPGTIRVNGGTMTLGGTWTNVSPSGTSGTIQLTSGTLNLGGSFSRSVMGTFTRTGGTVNLTGTLAGSLTLDDTLGSWNLAGGTLVNGAFAIAPASTAKLFLTASSTVDHVTLNSPIDLTTVGNIALTVRNGLTLNTTLPVGDPGGARNVSVLTSGSQTIRTDSAGTMDFGLSFSTLQQNSGDTLTIEPGVTLRGASRATVGSTNGTLINQGRITTYAPSGAGSLTVGLGINGLNAGVGVIEALGGGSLTITAGSNAAWTNQGTITAAGGGTLTLGFQSTETWTNQGTITTTGSTLAFKGQITQAGLGNLQRDPASTISLTTSGTLTGDLTLDDTTGPWNIGGGTLKIGAFRIAPGSSPTVRLTPAGNANLDNYTLFNPFTFTAINQLVTVFNGLTLNTNQSFDPNIGIDSFYFSGSQTLKSTLPGGAEIIFAGTVSGNSIRMSLAGTTLTIDPSIRIHGKTGSISGNGGTIINRGTITEDGGGTIDVQFWDNGRNEGTITAVAGGSLNVQGGGGLPWMNLGTISITGGGTLQLGFANGESWTNRGTITATGSTVLLNANITQAGLGIFQRDATSTVKLDLNAVLTGGLTLDDTTGSWVLANGQILGGTITTSGSARLFVTGGNSNSTTQNVLKNVTVNGTIDVTVSTAVLDVQDSLTLYGTILLGNTAPSPTTGVIRLVTTGSTVLMTGTGAIVMGTAVNSIFGITNQTLVVDSGFTIRGNRGQFLGMSTVDNRGTIAVDGAGGLFDLNQPTVTNRGMVRATGGAEVLFVAGRLTNVTGTTTSGQVVSGTLTGGAWSVGAGSTLRIFASTALGLRLTRLNAAVTLDGGGSNVYGGVAPGSSSSFINYDALNALTEIGGDGSLTLTNGRSLAPYGDFTTAGQVTLGPNSRLTPTGPIGGFWAGEGSAADATGHNTGATTTGVTFVTGQVGQAFSFNGPTGVVTVPDHPTQRSPQFTVAAWVNPADFAGHTNATVLMKTSTSSLFDGYALSFGGVSGRISFWLNPSSNAITSVNPLPLNAWSRVVASYDGVTMRLNVNGAEVATKAYSSPVVHTTQPLRIGSGPGGLFPFQGLIDEVGVFTRALTPAQVDALAPSTHGSYTQTAGRSDVRGGTLLVPGDTFTLQAGTLGGTGTVNTSVTNSGGSVAPGNSPGFIDITGNYVQGPNGTLLLEFAGRDPDVPQFDRLRVTGTATLDGTVRVELLNAFEPAPGDDFRVLSSALRVGQFATHDFPPPGGPARQLTPLYDGTGLTVHTQTVPPITFGYATTAAPNGSQNPERMQPNQVALDAAGNAYVVGSFQGVVDFDREHAAAGDTLTSAGTSPDGFLAKYDPSGMLLWVKALDGTGRAAANGVAIDPLGNANPADDRVYVVGSFDTGLTYPAAVALSGSSSSGFLLRTDANGSPVQFGALPSNGPPGTPFATINRVAVGPNGNITVAGTFGQVIDLDPGPGTTPVSAVGSRTGLVAEYTPAFGFVRRGVLISFPGATPFVDGADVAVDANGDVWFAGTFSLDPVNAPTTLGQATLASAGGTDAFLLKLRGNAGNYDNLVARSYGGPGDDTGTSVAVDPAGNVVLGGTFQFDVDFDVDAAGAFTLVSGGDADAFVLKLDVQGGFQWARAVGGYRTDRFADLTADALGNVYATGAFTDRADFDPLDGVYVLATGSEQVSQAFVLKLDAAGQFGWAAQLGNQPSATAAGAGIATDAVGRVVSVGTFIKTVDFDPTDGTQLRTYTPSSPVATAGYVSRLDQKAAPQAVITGLPTGPVVEGTALALTATVTDADSTRFTYAWNVVRDGSAAVTGAGPVVSARLADQGTYVIALIVTDESGNTALSSASVVVTNAAPTLNAATFAAGLALPGPAPAAGDNFGATLVAGGGFALAAAPAKTVSGQVAAGAVLVYDAAGNFVRTLTAPTPAANAKFGTAAAVVGAYAVVGATGAGTGGTVYVYSLATGALVRTITGPTPAAGDRFGAAVGAVGNLVLVGAPGRTTAAGAGVGEGYLFDPSTGTLVQTYVNPTPAANDEFGAAVAAAGANVLIGAPGDDQAGLDAGAAYLFAPATGQVAATLLFPNPLFPGSRFGAALAATSAYAIVGAPLDDSSGTADAGGAYVFGTDPTSTTFGHLVRTLRSPNAGAGKFGQAVAAAGTRAVIGADADGQTVANSGAAFVVDLDSSSPTFGTARATLKRNGPVNGDRFGAAVALSGDDVWVGAPQVNGAGAAFRFAPNSFLTLGAANVSENGTATVTGSFADPGTGDTHTVLIDWGDSTPQTRLTLAAGVATFSAAHQYLDDNPTGTPSDVTPIRVRVQDDTADVLGAVPAQNRLVRFDGTTTTACGQFVAGLTAPSAVAVGPDGDIYASGGALGTNPVLRFNGATGALVGTFIAAGTQGTTTAADLAFGPDGNLYYADAAGNQVLKFDGRTGAFLGFAAAAGSGGLSSPRGLAFGPDGNLYVASFATDNILRFNPTTGAFLGAFVPAGSGGLDGPADLTFGPDGDLYVLSAVGVPAVLRFDGVTGEASGTLANPALTGTAGSLLAGPGELLTVADPGGAISRYSLATGDLAATVPAAGAGALAGLPPQDESTTTVTIQNLAPAVTVRTAPNPTGAPAGAVTLTAVAADVGTQDTLTFAWAVTGGTEFGATTGATFTFTPTGGLAFVTLTVTDDDTGTVKAGTQVVFGTAGGDTISVNNGSVTVNGVVINYQTPPAGFTLNRVVVYGQAGNDTITASGVTNVNLAVELIGGAGNDTLTGGAGNDVLLGNSPGDYALGIQGSGGDLGNDSLSGGAGSDTLDGGLGNDTMAGGTGNDTYVEVPGSDDVLTEAGASGIDTIDFSIAFRGITLSLAKDAGQAQTVDANGHIVELTGTFENLAGSGFADVLTGNSQNNSILGGAGNDRLFGDDALVPTALDGDDTLAGGAGNDSVTGGDGNDIVFGDDLLVSLANGDDTLVGGRGNDSVTGGDGNDIVFGGDTLTATTGDGDDTLVGGRGNDSVTGGDGNDIVFGDDLLVSLANGDDTLVGGRGNDSVTGGDGNDIVFGGDLLTATTGDGDDTLVGGRGNDSVTGGDGNDIIFGDDMLATLANGDDTLVGGRGNDSVTGGDGNDIVFGDDTLSATPPDTSLDTLVGGRGNDSILGGDGNDMIFGDDLLTSTALDGDDTLVGGRGNDSVTGGDGNDIVFGDDLLVSLANGDDTLVGGAGNDSLTGGDGNDLVFGGVGDDLLTGNGGPDQFEGGSGTDRIIEVQDADMILDPTTLTVGSLVERFYDIEHAALGGGAGNNKLDASTFPGPVTLSGAGGNDTLFGAAAADLLSGGSGNDILFGGGGDDTLDPGSGNDAADGGIGNDIYFMALGGADTVADADGIDSIDLSASAFAADVDLTRTAPQIVAGVANTVTLVGAFENVRGTSYADSIQGDAGRNILQGGGGPDRLDGRGGVDTVQGGFPQVVYLDFESATGLKEHVYTIDERNAIQARLEQLFAAPYTITFTQTAPAVGRFATILINSGDTEDNEVLIGGQAAELDWRNVDPASRADVNINTFLGRKGQPAASSANYVGLTGTVIAHELGHLFGLRHHDSFGPLGINPATGLPYGVYAGLIARSTSRNEVVPGTIVSQTATYRLLHGPVLLAPVLMAGNIAPTPHLAPVGQVFDGTTLVANFVVSVGGSVQVTIIGNPVRQVVGGTLDANTGVLTLQWTAAPSTTSIVMTYDYDPFRPGYRGPDDAFEAPQHVMASPASVGSTVANATAGTYFGERELIKLAFADAGVSVLESALNVVAAPPFGTGRDLGTLPTLAVPNLLPAGTTNAGRHLQVRALDVVGTLTTPGQVAVYAVQGKAGEYLSVEALSVSLRQRIADPIDPVIKVYNAAGLLLDYYGQPAVNDDGIDSQDSVLLDVLLPADGIYYVTVNAFLAADVGGYELFLYSYTPPVIGGTRLGGAGDTMIGGSGPDVLIGGAGDDQFKGTVTEDTFIGVTFGVDVISAANTPPVATDQSVVTTEDTAKPIILTATDADGDPMAFSVVTGPAHGTLSGTAPNLTYTPAANYSGPDSFTFKANDGTADGNIATVSITVTPVNDTPVAANQAVTTNEDTAVAITLAASDVDGDPLVYSIATIPMHGTLSGSGSSLTYSPAANYNGPDSFTFRASDGSLFSSTATVSISVTPVNDPPTANSQTVTTPEDTPKAIVLTAADVDGDTLSFVVVTDPAHGSLSSVGANLTYTPVADYNGPDNFTFRASDGQADSDIGTVSVTIAPVNDAPTANGQTVTAAEDTPKPIVLSASDVEGNPLTYAVVTGPAHGTLSGTVPNLTYTPAPDYHGPDGFTFKASDGAADSNVATVSIAVTPVNDPPVASADAYLAPKGGSLTVSAPGVLSNDTDPDHDSLAATLIGGSGPAHGSLTLNADGSFTYTPAAGYAGPDSFTYAAGDGNGGTANATVQITVQDQGQLTVQITGAPATAPEGSPIPLGSAVTDPAPGATFTYAWEVRQTGVVPPVATGTGPGFTFTPPDNGAYTVTLSVSDGQGASGTDSKTVNVTNVAPTASVTRSGVVGATTVAVTVGWTDPHDVAADAAAGFRYSFASSAGGLATTYAAAGTAPAATFTFPQTAGTYPLFLRIFDKDGGRADATVTVLIGTAGNDRLTGTAGIDLVFGLAGDDNLTGLGANDYLDGGDGRDVLDAGDGDDELYGRGGNDVLSATTGNDQLLGGTGNDVLRGGAGNDSLSGEAGDDWLFAAGAADRLEGGAGNDALFANRGEDTALGGDGDDWLVGSSESDSLDGGTGNDFLLALGGNDTLIGGAGNDALDGGFGDDAVFGNDGNDWLLALTGHDLLDGGAGDDDFAGWGAAFVDDILQGGSGSDRIVNPGVNGDLTVAAFGPALGIEQIVGSSYYPPQQIVGTDADNVLDFSATTLVGIDVIDLRGGNDRVVTAALTPGLEYHGGSGNDTVVTGQGADILFGDGGADVFRFISPNVTGEDQVRDFNRGQDKIDLSAFAGVTMSSLTISRSGSDTLVRVALPPGSGATTMTIRLKGFTQALDASDFIFAP